MIIKFGDEIMGNWIPKYWWSCSNESCMGSHYTDVLELKCYKCGKITKSKNNPLHLDLLDDN
jgi:hypothetical protein